MSQTAEIFSDIAKSRKSRQDPDQASNLEKLQAPDPKPALEQNLPATASEVDAAPVSTSQLAGAWYGNIAIAAGLFVVPVLIALASWTGGSGPLPRVHLDAPAMKSAPLDQARLRLTPI